MLLSFHFECSLYPREKFKYVNKNNETMEKNAGEKSPQLTHIVL